MKSNHTTSRENVQDIIAQHNIDINETMERVSQVLTKHSIRIETTCTHEWSESQEKKLDELMNRADRLMNKVQETKISPWKRWLRDGMAAACPFVVILFCVAIGIYTHSPQYWGKRYYAVCNHPRQDNKGLIEHKDVAYEDVVHIFEAGKESKKRMKAFIREQEQRLERMEIDH